jgi:hypothetical protein
MTLQEHFLRQEVPTLLDDLTADTQALWGAMTAQHMLEHVSGLFYIALGKRAIPLMVKEEQLEKAQEWLMSDKEFRPGILAPGVPQKPGPLRFASFDEAKAKFAQTLQAFNDHFQQNPTAVANHPVFGKLNKSQWEQFHYKHTQHHFMQFGLIPMSEYKKRKLDIG